MRPSQCLEFLCCAHWQPEGKGGGGHGLILLAHVLARRRAAVSAACVGMALSAHLVCALVTLPGSVGRPLSSKTNPGLALTRRACTCCAGVTVQPERQPARLPVRRRGHAAAAVHGAPGAHCPPPPPPRRSRATPNATALWRNWRAHANCNRLGAPNRTLRRPEHPSGDLLPHQKISSDQRILGEK